jgi:hypothetical protein
VVPVQLILSGVGLKQLWAHYDKTPSVAALFLPIVVNALITTPLVTAMTIYAVLDLGEGRRPRAREAILRGLEIFGALLPVVLLAAIGIVLGFIALIIPGVFLAIRWYFVPQAVVLEGTKGPAALTASARTVERSWWRTLGVVIVANLAAAIPGLLLVAPFTELASSSDRQVWALVGETAAEVISTPFIALVSTLLWFDLRTRRRA